MTRDDPRFVVQPLRFRRDHAGWSNGEVAAWLDLFLASYHVGGSFDSPNVARAFLGGRGGALDALIERGAFVEDGDEWHLADYAELYEGRTLRNRKTQAERLAEAEAAIAAGEPLTNAERLARHRARRHGADLPDPRKFRNDADEDVEVDIEVEVDGRNVLETLRHEPTTSELNPCPRCGAPVRFIEESKRGPFYGCSEFSNTGCPWKSNDPPKLRGRWEPSPADLAVIEGATPLLRKAAGE
jgi:hypothetical protein